MQKQNSETMSNTEATLDLRQDFVSIREFLRAAAAHYAAKHGDKPVTGLQVYFAMENGFLEVYFWDAPDYQPFALDARHCLYAETLPLPHWQDNYERRFEAPTLTIALDGTKIETQPDLSDPDLPCCIGDEEILRTIGVMIVGLLVAGRGTGLFGSLPMTPQCRLVVQNDETEFWWQNQQ